MRRSPRPPISNHRVARFNAWARLWLMWFVGFCTTWWFDDREQKQQVARAAHGVASLIVLNVLPRVLPNLRASNHRHGKLRPAKLRALIGSRLRRALAGTDWPSRLAAILSVMRDFDAHVATLARRLAKGLTCLRVIDLKPEHAPALAFAPLLFIARRDSS